MSGKSDNGPVFRALTERELEDIHKRLDEIREWMQSRPCAAHGERLARVEVRAAMIAVVIAALVVAGVKLFTG